MGKETKIEYCDSTANPVHFCSGCELYNADPDKNHCYAATLCNRYQGRPGWPETFTTPAYFLERIEQALRWPDLTGTERPNKPWLNGYPRIVFLNDLGDGFSRQANPYIWLEPYMERMAASPHIWLLLTKWPMKMSNFFWKVGGAPSNFWLGTTVTSQERLDRAYNLVVEDGITYWLSLEPLLGPVELPRDLVKKVRWVVAGGESGKNARPMHPSWIRAVRNKVAGEGVPFFFKQWGGADKKAAGRELDGRLWSGMPRMGR